MESDLNHIREMFSKMNSDGFDTTLPLRWGFFFFDKRKDRLENLAANLHHLAYHFENIEETDDQDELVLQVSKIDTLTPDELHEINLNLNGLAEKHGVALYDGWDVGKIREKAGET